MPRKLPAIQAYNCKFLKRRPIRIIAFNRDAYWGQL
jgi:hypothetical protein